jgi:hypothetical protein
MSDSWLNDAVRKVVAVDAALADRNWREHRVRDERDCDVITHDVPFAILHTAVVGQHFKLLVA